MYIINSRGEQEQFSLQKVERSARRVGANFKLAREIAQQIERKIYNGIPTFEIFKEVKELLNQAQPVLGLKFSLKQAMRDLGPDGFAFEKYAGAIFREAGYAVKLNQFISGKCLSQYEIDFTAEKAGILKIGECKYHSQASDLMVDQEIALANYARFADILQGKFALSKISQGKKISSILITNTKFSTRAIQYSECSGVELWGWKYPFNKGLEVFIDQNKLYPITILPSFKKQWADLFNQRNIILAGDILKLNLERISRESNISLAVFNKMTAEAKTLLEG
ncbi:MAG: hypothetical protein NTZ42_03250 [Candidatus Gribaldobacteria bacterium]|nr:hypothetical protein [Candidatus Gribaldobacteria bacterium]